MTWENNLLTAAFRDVEFVMVSIDDAATRALARHSYPYKDGADVEDMGRDARRFSVHAIFFGDDYESRLQIFIDALDVRGAGPLVHPVFGNIEKVQVADYRIHHDSDNPDACTITIEFEESIPAQPFFSRQLASQKADAIDSAAAAVEIAGIEVLIVQFDGLAMLAGTGALDALARLGALQGQAVAFLTNLNAEVRGIVASITDPIRGVIAFAADVKAFTQSLIDILPP